MTWDQIESSWKQLKGNVQLQTRAAKLTGQDREAAVEAVEVVPVSYKRSLHHGSAFIRRRKPAGCEQAGWTAAR